MLGKGVDVDLERVLVVSLSPNVTGSDCIWVGVEKEEETVFVVVPLRWVGFALYNVSQAWNATTYRKSSKP